MEGVRIYERIAEHASEGSPSMDPSQHRPSDCSPNALMQLLWTSQAVCRLESASGMRILLSSHSMDPGRGMSGVRTGRDLPRLPSVGAAGSGNEPQCRKI
ncbi:hypothetical protein D3C71_1829840 [compost metagenome]